MVRKGFEPEESWADRPLIEFRVLINEVLDIYEDLRSMEITRFLQSMHLPVTSRIKRQSG